MKLKKYSVYLKKIKAYAKMCRVSIKFVNHMEEGGAYLGNRRSISISKKLSNIETIATLLHELGHFIDDLRNPHNHLSNRFHNGARTAIEEDRKLTFLQKKRLLKIEREAWKNARALARQLDIPLGAWFYKDEKSALATYYAKKTIDQ